MLHKIPIPIPTPEGISFIPKIATSFEMPYSIYAYGKGIDPDPKDPEGNEFGWWCFDADEMQSKDEQNLFYFAVCDFEMCNVIMDNFIDNYAVEAAAGTAPTQAEGEAIC